MCCIVLKCMFVEYNPLVEYLLKVKIGLKWLTILKPWLCYIIISHIHKLTYCRAEFRQCIVHVVQIAIHKTFRLSSLRDVMIPHGHIVARIPICIQIQYLNFNHCHNTHGIPAVLWFIRTFLSFSVLHFRLSPAVASSVNIL